MHRLLAIVHPAILHPALIGLAFLLPASPLAFSQPSSPTLHPALQDTIAWHVVAEWGVEGRGWNDVQRYYDRLPARAEGVVRDAVWRLSHNSAGMSCRFTTDAPEIQVRYTLLSPGLEMTHMPASGVSGVDLYTLVEDDQWRYIATVRPASQRVCATVARGIAPGRRTYMLNLPLYNGIDSLEIGVTRGAAFEPIPPRSDKPVVFYGTSITQGGCASRPGMAFPAILGRRLNIPVINLGFSGNGKMEPEMCRLLTELDAASVRPGLSRQPHSGTGSRAHRAVRPPSARSEARYPDRPRRKSCVRGGPGDARQDERTPGTAHRGEGSI